MITLALTYRNRDLGIVKNCLDSLAQQSYRSFQVILVDYGSEMTYSNSLRELIGNYPFVQLISCPVQGQLWNKSRAINIVLKLTETPYFLVGDIDMIFRKDFFLKLFHLKNENTTTYFQVGFLNKEESKKIKPFEEYKINHLSSKDATGMTLYPTALLKSINGYDEFYHGWGAEDTDVHVRLQNKRAIVNFYNEEVLILHQWHPKSYRTRDSLEPYHSQLEKINHRYIQQTEKLKVIKANSHFNWGILPTVNDYSDLEQQQYTFSITNEKNDIEAFLAGTLFNLKDVILDVEIATHLSYKSLMNKAKKLTGKKHYQFFAFDEINDAILLTVISSFRNQPYHYEYSKIEQIINFKIKL